MTGPIAIFPWGEVIELFLDPLGLTAEDFAERMDGGWLFGYIAALARQGRQEAALETLESAARVIEGKPGRTRALTEAAFGVLAKGTDRTLARNYFQKAQKSWPGIVDVLQNDEM